MPCRQVDNKPLKQGAGPGSHLRVRRRWTLGCRHQTLAALGSAALSTESRSSASYAAASVASGNLRPPDGRGLRDDLTKLGVAGCVPGPPGDVAADHAGLPGVAVVVGAVQGEVAQRGELSGNAGASTIFLFPLPLREGELRRPATAVGNYSAASGRVTGVAS